MNWAVVDNDLAHRINSLAVLTDANQTVLGGTNGAGLYRQEGTSWKRSTAGMKEALITSIDTDRNSSHLFAVSSGAGCSYCYFPHFLFTKKHATVWSNLTIPDEIGIFQLRVEADPSDPSHLHLLSKGYELYVSFNTGKTWTLSQFDQENSFPSFVTQDAHNSKIVYSCAFLSCFRSVDGGSTYQHIPIDFSAQGARGNGRIVIDENDSNVLYFLFSRKGIFRSPDGGATVAPAMGNPPNGGWSMTQLPGKDSFILLDSGGRIYRTSNAGQAWKELSQLDHAPGTLRYSLTAEILAADRKGRHFFVTIGDRFLYESLDGGKNWSDVTAEFGTDVQVHQITDPRNVEFFVATSTGVFQYQP